MSESHIYTFDIEVYDPSRNPLKSGQCFLRQAAADCIVVSKRHWSQSPQIGSMFPTWDALCNGIWERKPESQSPQIGSMFPTKKLDKVPKDNGVESRNPLKSGQCFLR